MIYQVIYLYIFEILNYLIIYKDEDNYFIF